MTGLDAVIIVFLELVIIGCFGAVCWAITSWIEEKS